MSQVLITNIASTPTPLGDLGSKSLAVGEAITIDRPANVLPSMKSLIAALAAGKITVAVTPTADELASGFLAPPQSVQPEDLAPVASSALAGVMGSFTKAFAAGAGGSADDVEIYAINTLPYKIRVLRAYLKVGTAVSGSNAQLRTRAAGAGQGLAQFDCAAVGHKEDNTVNATSVLTPGALVGLYVRRSDSGIAGEIVIEYRRES